MQGAFRIPLEFDTGTNKVVMGDGNDYEPFGLPPFTGADASMVTAVSDPVTRRVEFLTSGSKMPQAAYLGLVATRGMIPSAFYAANKQLMSRSKHIATENIGAMQLVLANWYCSISGEATPGAATTYTASIEYPVGTITRATFSGAFSGVVADGANIITDAIAVSIPKGAAFYVRIWYSNSAGIIYNYNAGLNNATGAAPASGEWCTFNPTTVDLTGVATNVNNAQAGICFKPVAIIGLATKPSYALLGDSRLGSGTQYDTVNSSYGGTGEVERALVKIGYATMNLGRSGEKASEAAGSAAARRIALTQYCSDIVLSYGINDCIASVAAATTFANLQTIASKCGNKPSHACTVSPKSSSSDSWATTANQTPDAAVNPLRVALNNLIRGGLPAPFSGHIDIADQTESARDSGLWKVTGVANGYTADGLHGNSAGNSLVENSTAFLSIAPV